jgi:hypothetical protein
MYNSKREMISLLYLLIIIIIIYNIIIVQSTIEFLNENDTDILFDLKEEVVLKRDSREIIYDGSGTISMIIRDFVI